MNYLRFLRWRRSFSKIKACKFFGIRSPLAAAALRTADLLRPLWAVLAGQRCCILDVRQQALPLLPSDKCVPNFWPANKWGAVHPPNAREETAVTRRTSPLGCASRGKARCLTFHPLGNHIPDRIAIPREAVFKGGIGAAPWQKKIIPAAVWCMSGNYDRIAERKGERLCEESVKCGGKEIRC